MIVTNAAAILTVIHTYQNSALLALTSRSLIMSALGLVIFVGYSILQLLIYFSLVRLDGSWAVILLLIGIWSHLYLIPAIWALVTNYIKQVKEYKNRPIS